MTCLLYIHLFLLYCIVGDLVECEDNISDIFVKGFTKLSVQIPILATLLSMIHKVDSSGSFSGVVMSKLGASILYALEQDEVLHAKLALRSAACLASSNCLLMEGAGGICVTLDALVEIVDGTGFDGHGGLSHAGQISAYLLANTVPWIVNALAQTNASGSGAVTLNGVRRALARVCSDLSSPFSVSGQQAIFHENIVHSTDDMAAESTGEMSVSGLCPKGPRGSACWDSLIEACKMAVDVINDAEAKVTEGRQGDLVSPGCMCTPWVVLREDLFSALSDITLLSFGDTFSTDILSLARSGKMGSKGKYCLPNGSPIGASTGPWLTPRFPVFDAESAPDCAQCAAMTELEKFILMDYYRDILYFFDPYLLEDGTRVGSVDLTIAHLLAVSKLAPGGGTNDQLHMEYMLLETIFQLVLQLPTSQATTAGHFRIILEIAKKQPAFGPAAALGVGLLYNLLPEMDTSAAHELARWMAFHLVNTKLSWPYWDHWAPDFVVQDGSSADSDSAAVAVGNVKMFCSSVIDHSARNALPGRVRTTIPESLHSLLPVECTPKCPLFDSNPVDGNENATVTTGSTNDANLTSTYDPSNLKSVAKYLKEELLTKREDPANIEEWLEALEQNALASDLETGYSVDAVSEVKYNMI